MGKKKWSKVSGLVASFLVLLLLISSIGPHSFGSIKDPISATGNPSAQSSRPVKPFPLNSTTSKGVNPYLYYSKEPAPMGVSDYGIGPNNTPYSYNSSSFLGKIRINSLETLSSNVTIYHTMSFQLNINLVYYNGAKEYVYWIQDVAILNTQLHTLYFLDNIWNNTNDSGNVLNSSVAGNGFLSHLSGHTFYLDIANESLPGGYVYMQNPSNFQLKVNSTVTRNNQPKIDFMYNDGYGWVSYDNVVFSFVNNLSKDLGFVVSGFDYEPVPHEFYDAELILGASFGGCTTSDEQSNLSLSLQYWNGHNYQEISNAFNFGSNTAETISNITSLSYGPNSVGVPLENITHGAGTPQQAYTSAAVSFLNVSVPLSSGILYANGSSIPFTGGEANLTLSPGSYYIKIYSNSTLYKEFKLNLTPDEYLMAKVNASSVNLTEYTLKIPGQPSNYIDYVILAVFAVSAVATGAFSIIRMRKKR